MLRYRLLFVFLLICLLYPASSVMPFTEFTAVEQPKEDTVYITRTGSKYHRATCRYLAKSKIKISKKEAVKGGYTACSVCRP